MRGAARAQQRARLRREPPSAPAAAAAAPALLLVVLSLVLLLSPPAIAPATAAPAAPAPAKKANVHTVFLTDCTAYSDWQTLVMVFGWRESGQPGPLTRVMCCTPEERAAYNKDMLALVPTHVAPSFSRHPRTGDEYAAYNKPAGVIDWLKDSMPAEEWVVVLDSDMILRRPFLPDDYGFLKRGWATGARYDYLIGVDNELATRHIPEVAPKKDALAGPAGRRADRIGGFYLIHRDDLKTVAPLWLKYAEDVRADPEVRGDFGESGSLGGERQSAGAACARLWVAQRMQRGVQLLQTCRLCLVLLSTVQSLWFCSSPPLTLAPPLRPGTCRVTFTARTKRGRSPGSQKCTATSLARPRWASPTSGTRCR
jgi:hypothetical protein